MLNSGAQTILLLFLSAVFAMSLEDMVPGNVVIILIIMKIVKRLVIFLIDRTENKAHALIRNIITGVILLVVLIIF